MDEITAVWPEWRTVELLGNGSFGSVYKAEKEDFGRKYYAAVKTLTIPEDITEVKTLKMSGMDEQSIRGFYKERVEDLVNEIQIMERLKTAGNIVSIEDYKLVEHDGQMGWTLYIRMELLQGLDAYMEEKGRLTPLEVACLGIDICSALECCEMSKTIHRDIKPENVFRNEYGTYKLGDFGLSKQMELASSARSSKGTPLYVAPEVYHGKSYGSTVDIYSLGIMLYRYLNGNRFPLYPPAPQPLRPNDISNALAARMEGAALPAPCDADGALAEIVLKACAYMPENRYQKASEMKDDLMKWQANKKYGAGVDTDTVSNENMAYGPKPSEPKPNGPLPNAGSFKMDNLYGKTQFIFQDSRPDMNYSGNSQSEQEAATDKNNNADNEYNADYDTSNATGNTWQDEREDGKDIYMEQEISLQQLHRLGEMDVELEIPNGKKLLVKVKDPTQDGAKYRFSGQGEKGKNGGKDGDLYVTWRNKKFQSQPEYKCPACGAPLHCEMTNFWSCGGCGQYYLLNNNGKMTQYGLDVHALKQALDMAVSYYNADNYQSAKNVLLQAKQMAPNSVEVLLWLGKVCCKLGDILAEEECYTTNKG